MAKDEEHLEHRGRFQAQGGGVEESESWAQDSPITVRKALRLLGRLINKLSKKDYQRREKSFEKAKQFVEEAGTHGGIFSHVSRSFRLKKSKDERVDIEVLSGRAFVPDREEDD
jgi:hypothetical protein